ncbi:hypothetical protein LOY67_02335 [Pseudomonas sp. B21-056]|uniref:hypothetical protein n=1 Tax=Pseudomonas sp. B21-056 TaxID=2895495 RepID=UPI002231A049|nr:hypothetical protein [Pseudomonas sp. B21-056]UZE24279.1 hypothetical protein LOY67_02335 [Pseudomonas sp. B21-056]
MGFEISWLAPIVPAKSLAGIPLAISVVEFEKVLDRYLVDKDKALYRFRDSPVLSMVKGIDSNGDGGYGFSVFDRELTNWRLFFNTPEHAGADPRALYVIVRSWEVYAVKAWMFEKYREGGSPVNSYKGKLDCDIGLGDALGDLLAHAKLEFDAEEEWYVASGDYSGLEVSGYGVSLEDNPSQVVMALAVLMSESV